ncbi:MAG: metallopeptidase, partial [Firmicutes bacterium]|nr:metallopeptidase [Bacillota bacterium]
AESMTPEELARLADLFLSDDHEGWYEEFVPESDEENSPDSQEKPDEQDSSDNQDKVEDNQPQQQQQQEEPQEQNQFQMPQQSVLETVEAPRQQEIEEIWKDISERMQVDLETLSKGKGDARGGLMQNLRPLNKKRYDYTTFLRKFSVIGEELKVNDDEFDYIFYTYGLKLYEKMPLIEPLEYKEDKRIRDFVIAIDTSGSVKGEMVQKFVEKTYSIIKQSESFFNKINLHIIQCDAEIQQDVKITSQEEFDDYIKNMKLFGFGGTDFRPVFEYVEKLREEKEFTDLRGLIYFTDGDGTFPKKMPDYKAAFVFIETEEDRPPVPPWAIQLVLEADDI